MAVKNIENLYEEREEALINNNWDLVYEINNQIKSFPEKPQNNTNAYKDVKPEVIFLSF